MKMESSNSKLYAFLFIDININGIFQTEAIQDSLKRLSNAFIQFSSIHTRIHSVFYNTICL